MWSSIKKHCVLIAAALLAAIPLTARAAEATEFNARIIANKTSVAAGQTIKLGVEFKIPAGKHIYFREAGDTGRPTTVEFALPDGSRVASLIWPRPLRIEDGGFVCFGYHDKTVISAEVTLPAAINGSTLNLHAKVSWLLCGDGSCMPGETELDLQLPVVSSASLSNDSPEAKSLNYKAFEGNVSEINANVPDLETATTQVQQIELQTLSLPYLLLLSFAAGLLLNLMPCVLPVLALKVMSLSKQAGQDRSVSLKLGAAYTLGTLATFAALATAMVAARSLGSSLGWGFQFQSLGYLVVMCSVICLMTLSIFGLFFVQIQTGVQELETVASKNGLLSAFARGISATLLSTP
jgi:thiol:disulfide interchange protein